MIMYRYHITASFDVSLHKPEYLIHSESSTVEAILPMLTATGGFRYGLQNTVHELRKLKIFPSESGFDAIIIALIVYIADMKISRAKQSQDSWSREIILSIPVYDQKWHGYKELLERMLKFLTGDLWAIEFLKRDVEFSDKEKVADRTEDYHYASLFSGGMDSLIAAINYMERGQATLLVSHAGEGRVRHWQTDLLSVLDERYGDIPHKNAYLWTSLTDIELPYGECDKNQRSRSFLFIAIALLAMSGTKNCHTLYMPENGLIALNVPLDSTRIGSHSTRTTHPFYLKMWNDIAYNIFGVAISNPYWNKTKGEMAEECLNQEALKISLGQSFSCSSVNNANIRSGHSQHCGHCLPCIIRRSAIYHAFGEEDPSEYLYPRVSDIHNNRDNVGEQLRSFEYAISKIKENPGRASVVIHKPGPLEGSNSYLTELADMYSRGLREVDHWIRDSLEKENAD